ncbi:MAG: beta-N-acetylhexosaminidase [Bacillota bacterium]|nr:beta-N-acetylhexosaminidase [Bacillota bacterium]
MKQFRRKTQNAIPSPVRFWFGQKPVLLVLLIIFPFFITSAGCQVIPYDPDAGNHPINSSSTQTGDQTSSGSAKTTGITGTSALGVTTTHKQATETGLPNDDLLHDQVRQMTLDVKIGQLIMAGFNNVAEAEGLVREISPGGLILFRRNIQTEQQTRQDISTFQAAVEDGLPPLFIAVDQEGGTVSRLPASAGVFESAQDISTRADVPYAVASGERTGRILREWGFNVNCAPVLDIGGNPDSKVIGTRAYGETAGAVIVYGLAVLQGLQNTGMLTVVKHFPGHGGTTVDSHLSLPVIDQSLAELQEEALRPFIAAIDADADMVMMAHIRFSQLDMRPASLSPVLVDTLLRHELGFSGVVLTDDLTMGAITDQYEIGEAAVLAVEAGCDLLLVCHDMANVYLVRDALMDAVQSGRLSEARIDASVERILLAKRRLS